MEYDHPDLAILGQQSHRHRNTNTPLHVVIAPLPFQIDRIRMHNAKDDDRQNPLALAIQGKDVTKFEGPWKENVQDGHRLTRWTACEGCCAH